MSTDIQVMNDDGIITEAAAIQEVARLVTERFQTLEDLGTKSHSVGFVTTADGVQREVFIRGAADKIVTDGERALLLTRNTLPGIGKLAFFGGLQDKGEKISSVAKREFDEESGLSAHFGEDIDVGEIFPITGDIRVIRPQPGREANFIKFAATIGEHGAKEGDLMALGTKISMSLISPAEFDALAAQSKAQQAKLDEHSEGENLGNVVVKLEDIVAGRHEMAFEHHVEIAKMAVAKLAELAKEQGKERGEQYRVHRNMPFFIKNGALCTGDEKGGLAHSYLISDSDRDTVQAKAEDLAARNDSFFVFFEKEGALYSEVVGSKELREVTEESDRFVVYTRLFMAACVDAKLQDRELTENELDFAVKATKSFRKSIEQSHVMTPAKNPDSMLDEALSEILQKFRAGVKKVTPEYITENWKKALENPKDERHAIPMGKPDAQTHGDGLNAAGANQMEIA